MSANNVKPAYNAKRRIQYLFVFVILLVIGCSAGWFFVADRIETASSNVIAEQAGLGNNINCDGKEVRGYPFRFGVFCDSVAFENPSQGIAINAGALRSAAQFYAPRDLILELDSPAMFDSVQSGSWSMKWSQMRARILVTDPLPQNISISGQDVVLAGAETEPYAKAAGVELFLRAIDQDVDLAGRTNRFEFENLTPQLNELPPLGADFDIRIADGVRILLSGQQSLRGVDATVKRLALLINDDRGIIVSGPVSVAIDGLLSGALKVRVVDVDGVLDVLVKTLPEFAPLMTAFANGQPRSGEQGDEIEMQITIDNGQARLGLIPLGIIAPL